MTIDVSAPAPLAPFPNERVEGYPTFIPRQPVPIGQLLSTELYPQNKSPAKLFEKLNIRGVEFGNKAWVSPMCQCEPPHHPLHPQTKLYFNEYGD